MNRNMKDIKLIRLEPFTDKDEFENNRAYLYLKYEYKDDNGNTHNKIYPKVELPICDDKLPEVDHEYVTLCKYIQKGRFYIPLFEDGLILHETDIVVNDEKGEVIALQNVSIVDVITKRTVKKMTLSEIEEKLGYKVEIVSEKG